MLKDVAIIGGGQAGFQTANALRQFGYQGRISLIHEETKLPYQRPPLSKSYVLGKTEAESLAFRPAKFYSDQRIELVEVAAEGIDRINRRVLLSNGKTISYDHLVLATGAHNRALAVPGSQSAGVLSLRNLGDADEIRERLKTSRHAVVVGAGFIGLEFAAVAASLGLGVRVLEMADRVMSRALSREMSQFFAKEHDEWDVRIDFGQSLKAIESGPSGVTAAIRADGERIPADLIVYGVGVIPNTKLAEEAGLDIQNGIKVDSHLLTSDPAISAAGDCCSFVAPNGESIRLESVQNAIDQATAIAARLVGRAAPYDAVPWFWSDQGPIKLQIAGLSTGYDTAVAVGSDADKSFSAILFRNEQLVAVESVNRAGDFMAARKLLGRQTSLSPREAAKPDFDLRAYEQATR